MLRTIWISQNNDLLEKKFGQCFANFFTNENQWANSVYRYRLGDVEFIALNSNTDYDYVSGQGALGNYVNTDAFLLDQAKWLPIFHSSCEGKLGISLEWLQGQ